MRELVAGLFITLDGEAGRFQDDRYRRAHRHLPPAEERLR
jgi:hypothetical protein